MEDPVWLPGIQVYEVPPVAFSVVLFPEQIFVLLAKISTAGCVSTVSVTDCVAVHPLTLVPVTVYVVVVVGETETLAPPKLPGIHVYMFPPVALRVAELPWQSEVFGVLIATGGAEFTVTVTVDVLLQPFSVPLTVYVVVAEGETESVLPVRLPGCQM
jgi:hypothetical protein